MSAGTGSTAATVYARSLMQAAGSSAPAVLADLEAILAMIEEGPGEWASLLSPQVSASDRRAALDTLLAQANPVTRNFVKVLADSARLGELDDAVAAFRELVNEQQRQLEVQITTAVDLPADLRATIEQRLSTSTGKSVRLHASVDPTIIGGLVIQHGDTLVDTSLRSRLEQLRLLLSRPSSTPTSPDA